MMTMLLEATTMMAMLVLALPHGIDNKHNNNKHNNNNNNNHNNQQQQQQNLQAYFMSLMTSFMGHSIIKDANKNIEC